MSESNNNNQISAQIQHLAHANSIIFSLVKDGFTSTNAFQQSVNQWQISLTEEVRANHILMMTILKQMQKAQKNVVGQSKRVKTGRAASEDELSIMSLVHTYLGKNFRKIKWIFHISRDENEAGFIVLKEIRIIVLDGDEAMKANFKELLEMSEEQLAQYGMEILLASRIRTHLTTLRGTAVSEFKNVFLNNTTFECLRAVRTDTQIMAVKVIFGGRHAKGEKVNLLTNDDKSRWFTAICSLVGRTDIDLDQAVQLFYEKFHHLFFSKEHIEEGITTSDKSLLLMCLFVWFSGKQLTQQNSATQYIRVEDDEQADQILEPPARRRRLNELTPPTNVHASLPSSSPATPSTIQQAPGTAIPSTSLFAPTPTSSTMRPPAVNTNTLPTTTDNTPFSQLSMRSNGRFSIPTFTSVMQNANINLPSLPATFDQMPDLRNQSSNQYISCFNQPELNYYSNFPLTMDQL